jgi:hypothetical protein
MNRSSHPSFGLTWFRGRLAVFLLAVFLPSIPLWGGEGPQPSENKTPREAAKAAVEPGAVEVHFNDGGILKLTLKDERIELITPYGKLLVPVADVRRIEFATRVPEADLKRVAAAIANLGSADFPVREAATAELLKLREKAYSALLRAAKDENPEVARRAEGLLEKIRDTVPEEQLETRPHDVIYTEHSKIAGRISEPALKANTTQFGELHVKLSDMRDLRSPLAAPDEPVVKDVTPAPVNMEAMQNQIGKTFVFQVTGAVGNGAQAGMPPGGMVVRRAAPGGMVLQGAVPGGSVWGTDVYTADSALALAAVHAGLLKPGQTGVIKVKMVPSPLTFQGSTRNGVTSEPFGAFPAAYRLSK